MPALLEQLRAGVITRSAGETRALAGRVAPLLPRDATLALHGDLGAGKTTFVQGLARGLGIEAGVTSPTFTIFTIHRGPRASLVHLDAYRLENDRQVESLMLEDFLTSPYVLAVEWPEKIASWLPRDAWHFTLEITPAQTHLVRLAAAGGYPFGEEEKCLPAAGRPLDIMAPTAPNKSAQDRVRETLDIQCLNTAP